MEEKDITGKEIRIICSGCKSVYFVPIEMMEFKGIIDMSCKKCRQLLEIRHHSLKEQMREEILEMIEKSTYAFLDLPPIKYVSKEMEEQDETTEKNNMVD